jgi:hypothetical protein
MDSFTEKKITNGTYMVKALYISGLFLLDSDSGCEIFRVAVGSKDKRTKVTSV